MKRGSRLNFLLAICGMCFATSAASHPYDSALKFREHTTDDGRSIYSNIPKKCFSKGRLTCIGLHPVFKGPGVIRSSEIQVESSTGLETDVE